MFRPAIAVTALAFLAFPVRLAGQVSPLLAEVTTDYQSVRDYFLQAAEQMPESLYAFKPNPAVRTFARQVAHVADDQYNLCSVARGEKRHAAYRAIEDSLSDKASLLKALKDAFAYCDAAYASLSEAQALQPAIGGKGRSRFGYLNWNMWHTWEHYGNIVVYFRINGLVPPSGQKMAGMKM